MRTATLWLTALSIALGFISAYAALHGAGDVLVYILLLMFGGLLGYIGSQAPWRWAIVLGIWVPIAQIVDRLANPGDAPATFIDFLKPLVALVPAFAGVYFGTLVRRIGRREPQPPQPPGPPQSPPPQS